MSKRGTCIGNIADCNLPGCQSINNTFIFSERPNDPESCYHCVRIFVRTVNIIEKQECKCALWARKFKKVLAKKSHEIK